MVHFQRNRLSHGSTCGADQAASSRPAERLELFLVLGRIVGSSSAQRPFSSASFVEFLDGIPVIGGDRRVEDVAIDVGGPARASACRAVSR